MQAQSAAPVVVLGALGAVLMFGLVGSQGLPQPGDTIHPRLVQDVEWKPGEEGELWVELAASSKSGEIRRLSFAATPRKNPTAQIQYFADDGQLLGSELVEISQRC